MGRRSLSANGATTPLPVIAIASPFALFAVLAAVHDIVELRSGAHGARGTRGASFIGGDMCNLADFSHPCGESSLYTRMIGKI